MTAPWENGKMVKVSMRLGADTAANLLMIKKRLGCPTTTWAVEIAINTVAADLIKKDAEQEALKKPAKKPARKKGGK